MMHLDTVMTMIDRQTFVTTRTCRPPAVVDVPASGTDGLEVVRNDDLFATIAEILGVDKITVLETDEDLRAAQREQWDDGNNFLAVEPGVNRRIRAQRHHQHLPAEAGHRGHPRSPEASSGGAAAARAA